MKKMNVLPEGQYTLSTEEEHKSIYFVKLTDSALQSIDECFKSMGDSSAKPSIHFEDNSGTISLPLNDRKCHYGFTLSSIEDGLQSSFQCLQYNDDNRSLKSLGIMLKKMHVHAKEDIYEKTKFKMAAAEKKQKNLCTKEIKSSRTLLSRKIEIKRPGLVSLLQNPQLVVKKPETSKINMKTKSKKAMLSKSSMMQLPIRKRIIHILAIKSYKKPEILLRLIKEGITSEDKGNFNSTLTEVGSRKGDVYILSNRLWNEVQNDWEFCSKEELQLIKRRKQQFLKSWNEHSDIDLKFPNECPANQKDTSEFVVAEKEPIGKKRMMSHNGSKIVDQVVKDNSSETSICKKLPSVNNTGKLSSSHHPVNGITHESKKDFVLSQEKNKNSSLKKSNIEGQLSSQTIISGQGISSRKQSFNCNFKLEQSKQKDYNAQQTTIEKLNKSGKRACLSVVDSESHFKMQAKKLKSNSYCDGKESGTECYRNKVVNNIHNHSDSIPVINNSVSCNTLASLCKENKKSFGCDEIGLSLADSILEFDYSDHLQKYITIESQKQRSVYAEEFNTEYEEYLRLHMQVKTVSEKFAYLENSLQACEEDITKYKKIKFEIEEESRSILQNTDYINVWKKFNLLRSKLSLIKQLIKEYDNSEISEN